MRCQHLRWGDRKKEITASVYRVVSSGDIGSQMFPGCGCSDAQVSLRPASVCREVVGCNVHTACNIQLPYVL